MADLLLMDRAYVMGCRFEKVRNGHRFENWTPIWEFEKGHTCIFENWTLIWEFEKNIDVCDVESDMDLRIGRRLESYMCTEESKLNGCHVKSCTCSEMEQKMTIGTIPKSNR